MYINFKSKYKKFLWLIIGFLLACFYIQKVNALENLEDGFIVNNRFINNELIDTIWEQVEGKTIHDLNNAYPQDDYIYSKNNFPYMYIQPTSGEPLIYFTDSIEFKQYYNSQGITNYNIAVLNGNVLRVEIYNGNFYYTQDNTIQINDSGGWYPKKSLTSFDFYINDNLVLPQYFYYSSTTNPDYLNGYTKVTLPVGTQYTMISSSQITSGYVFIPIDDFNNYGGRLSYFDKDLSSQPYTSYIQDYTTTPDGLYARQYFDLSSYNGAEWVMFSKYIYLEGEDNITYDIWIPTDSYSSSVVVTPNTSGGNDFDFSYVDQNGELQADTISSVDLTPPQPLLGDMFQNFTSNDFGLSSIITAPLPLIQSLNSATCSDISLPLGIFGGVHDHKLVLPCMTPLYQNWFGNFFTLYQTITTGFIAYYVGLGFFNKIKQLKDPENDKIEVVDL